MTIVPPSGPLDAPIALVGARPGRDEIYSRQPFTGPSGDLLWRLLRIPRNEVYTTNVRRDFSSTNATPTRDEVQEALPALREELEKTSANVLVALGSQALYALTGRESIEAWRGSVLPSTLLPGRKVIPTWHPAACLRNFPWTYVVDFDLRRVRRESNYPDIRRPVRTFTINAGLGTTLAYLDSLGDPISVDIETFGRGSEVRCVAISDRADRAICIPFVGGSLSISELTAVWRRLDSVFRARGIIGQNIQFDTTRLEQAGFRLPRLVFDTMLAHHLLWPEFDHDLGFIVSIYTDEPHYKHEIASENLYDFWAYNCKDAACTYEAYEKLSKELEEAGQTSYFKYNVMGLIRPVMDMQARGFCVDFDRLHKQRKRLELEIEYLQLQLNAAVGFECNVRSVTDLRFLLFDTLRLPKLKETKGGKPATDEETLRRLAYSNSQHSELFKLVLDIRERRTLVSGFLNLETDDDNRYKANYLIHGTDSGRLSSRAARKGPQLQNVPRSARGIFVAAGGCGILQGDLRRAEAMFVAYDAEELGLIGLFADESRDLYKEVAARALGIGIETIEPWQRDLFKRVVHAANYGMGPRKFIIVLRLAGINIEDLAIRGIHGSERKAEFLIESYHGSNPNIRRWQSSIRSQVSRSRILSDALGRRRTFLGRMDDSLHRAAFSFRPQATIVGVTNIGLQRAYAAGEVVLAQTHDSIALEVRDEDRTSAMARLTEYMTYPLELHGRKFTIPVELAWGLNWGEMIPVS